MAHSIDQSDTGTAGPPAGTRPDTSPDGSRRRRTPRRRRWWVAGIGVVATALTLTVAQLVATVAAWASLVSPAAGPFDALGAATISVTPGPVKEFAIGLFGHADRAALVVVMILVLLALGAAVGIVAARSWWAGAALATALLVVVAVAILTRPDTGAGDIAPLVLGGLIGLGYLHRALHPPLDPYAPPHTSPENAEPVAAPLVFDRRRLLRLAGIGAVSAALAALATRLVPTVADIRANRAAVRLPPLRQPGAGQPETTLPSAGSNPPAGTLAVAPPAAAPAVLPPALPPNANPDVPGITPFVTPDGSFYRVDTAFTLPRVTTDAWHLTVHGMVRRPFTLTWADLVGLPQVERWLTLACVSNEVGGNLVGNAAWQGVRIAELLRRAEPLAGADCLYSTSADGFTVTTPLDAVTDGRDALIAIGMNGSPLPIEHGFPARMVVPGLYGYVSATKWVVDLKVTTFAQATAFWTENGWAAKGPVKTASRIDTPGYDVALAPGTVPVAGVAWAQHRGISAVQVQVDDGAWVPAELGGAASKDTWRQWVYRWDTSAVARGKHVLRCRAIDGTGAVQIATPAPPAPNGASGYHTVPVVVG